MNRGLSAGLAGLAILTALTACSNVSAADVEACEARGGKIEARTFPYEGEGFWATDSGDLEYCELPSGAIGAVYNEEVTKLDTGFFGDTDENVKVFRECSKLGAKTYLTTVYPNDTTYDRFVCVRDGRVKKLL